MKPAQFLFDRYKSRFEVLPASGDWRSALRDLLTSSYGIRSAGAQNLLPFLRTLKAAKLNGCRTIIVERDYVDPDYLDEYARFYCRTFQIHSPRCTRVHFFNRMFTESALAKLENFAEAYIGFTVLRPTTAQITGRTVLNPRVLSRQESYVLCKARFEVNVAGAPLTVTGAPFMQQDSNVGACAQAALWMMSLFMHERYGFARHYPGEISSLATRFLATSGGRDGLRGDHILEAIRAMGFVPHWCEQRLNHKNEPVNLHELSKFIYTYIESEIPVLIAFNRGGVGHAIAAVGHTYRLQPLQLPGTGAPAQELRLSGGTLPYRVSSQWVGDFIVNDDAEGPYRHFANNVPMLSTVYSAFATVPAEVNLTSDDAENHAVAFLSAVNSRIPEQHRLTTTELSDLVLRTYLIRSNKYKEQVSHSTIRPDVAHIYRSSSLPKFLWVVELSRSPLVSRPVASDRRMVGEIVLDATANPGNKLRSVLSFHLEGRVLTDLHEAPILFRFPAKDRYNHLVR